MSDETIVAIVVTAICVGLPLVLWLAISYKTQEITEDRKAHQNHVEKWSIYEKVIRCRKCKTYFGAVEAYASDGKCPHCGGEGPVHPVSPNYS